MPPRLGAVRFEVSAGHLESFLSKFADADDELWLQRVDCPCRGAVAYRKQLFALVPRELIRCSIAAAVLHKGQRTVIGDKVFCKKSVHAAEARQEQFPESAAADFAFCASETLDRSLWVLRGRAVDMGDDPKAVADA